MGNVLREKNFNQYKNVDPKSFIPSIEYLINEGYHVLRMGKGFTEAFPYKHEKFIDYAVSKDRSDFLDIWLAAYCNFYLSTSSGIGALPIVFNKPCLFVNLFPIGRLQSWLPKTMYVFRNAIKDNYKSINEV